MKKLSIANKKKGLKRSNIFLNISDILEKLLEKVLFLYRII